MCSSFYPHRPSLQFLFPLLVAASWRLVAVGIAQKKAVGWLLPVSILLIEGGSFFLSESTPEQAGIDWLSPEDLGLREHR